MKSLKKISLFLFISMLISSCGTSAFWPFNKRVKNNLNLGDKIIIGLYLSANNPIILYKLLKKFGKNKKQKKDMLLNAIDKVKPNKAIKKRVNHLHKRQLTSLIKEYNKLNNNFLQNHPRLTSLWVAGSSGIALFSTIIAIAAGKAFWTTIDSKI